MVKFIRINILESSKVRFFNDPAKLNIRYTTLLNVNLLLILRLISSNPPPPPRKLAGGGIIPPYSSCLYFQLPFIWTLLNKKGISLKIITKKSEIYRWTNKLSGKTKSLPVCAIKMDTGVSYEFASITKAAEFLKVTIYFLNRCIREGKSCKGYSVTRKK